MRGLRRSVCQKLPRSCQWSHRSHRWAGKLNMRSITGRRPKEHPAVDISVSMEDSIHWFCRDKKFRVMSVHPDPERPPMHLHRCSTGGSRKTIPSLRITSIRGRPGRARGRSTGISRFSSLKMETRTRPAHQNTPMIFGTMGKVNAVRFATSTLQNAGAWRPGQSVLNFCSINAGRM